MYSVVLMAALSSGGTVPEHCFGRGCGGYYAGHGCYASCNCYGVWNGCHGCYNGCWNPCFGGYGYSYWCSGACYSFHPYHGNGYFSHTGYHSWHCYGFPCYGYGYGCFAYAPGWYDCWAGYDCYGGWTYPYANSCWSPYFPLYSYQSQTPGQIVPPDGKVVPPPNGKVPPPDDKGKKDGKKKDGKEKGDKKTPPPDKNGESETSAQENAPARLIVELPADAKLYVDNTLTRSTSARRLFQTPALKGGQSYYYILRAEFERDGQPVRVTGRVVVRAGQEVTATLSESAGTGIFVVRATGQ